jgi:hypothetical protein
MEKFYLKLGEEISESKTEEKLEISKNLYHQFENRLTEQFECLEVIDCSSEIVQKKNIKQLFRNYVIGLYFESQRT